MTERPFRIAATLAVTLALPAAAQPGNPRPTGPEPGSLLPGRGPARVDSTWIAPLGEPDAAAYDGAPRLALFADPAFRPMAGNRELMLATWYARLEAQGITEGEDTFVVRRSSASGSVSFTDTLVRTLDFSRTNAVAVERRLVWYTDRALLASRVRQFGPAVGSGALVGDVIGWMDGPTGPWTERDARSGPARRSWWARVRVPVGILETPGPLTGNGSPAASGPVAWLDAARPRPLSWTLERRPEDPDALPDTGWERLALADALPDAHAAHDPWTTEDWFFDPVAFTLHARVVALDWTDAERSVRYRLRLAE
jgi:hypothetical protein